MIGARETGNETYAVNLLNALARTARSQDTIIAAVARPGDAGARLDLRKNDLVVQVSESPFRRMLVDLPALARRHGADVLHVTYAGPLLCHCPMVVTVHDVSFRRNPEWFSPRDRLVLNTGIGATLRRARAVITISRFSRGEISRFYGIPEALIHVTHLAPGAAVAGQQSAAGAAPSGKFSNLRPYVLAVGNLQPRKNLARLASAFAGVCRRGAPHRLVIAGKAEWKESDVYRAIRECGIEDRVVLPGYVPDGDLPDLYRDADVFVFPSLYEGFGLPVLEAMACGAPVVCSSAASLPEVAGDAALMADPNDTGSIENALMEVISDPVLRASLRAKGQARAAGFSWRRTAEETLAVYRSVLRS